MGKRRGYPKTQQYGEGVRESIARALSNVGLIGTHETHPDDLYKGETHAIQRINGKNEVLNWAGPGTNVRQRLEDLKKGKSKPKSKLDEFAMAHDVTYNKLGEKFKNKEISKPQLIESVHEADDEFIKGVRSIPNIDFTAKVAANSILLKKKAEQLGILDTSHFSGGAALHKMGEQIFIEKYRDPAYKLRQKMSGKGQEGGFAFAPFLLPILGSLSATAIEAIIKKVTQKGKGQSGKGKEDRIEHLIDLFEKNVKPEKQIELVTVEALKDGK